MSLFTTRNVINILNALDTFFLLVKPDGEIVFINEAFSRRLGSTSRILAGTSAQRIQDSIEFHNSAGIFSNLGALNLEDKLPETLPPLSLIWWEVFIDEVGEEVLGYLLKEIATEPNQKGSIWELEESQFTSILDVISDPAILLDDRGLIKGINEPGIQTFGYERSHLLEKPLSKLMPPSVAKDYDDFLGSRFTPKGQKKKAFIGRDMVGRKKDGDNFSARLIVREISTKTGKTYFIGTLTGLNPQKTPEKIEAGVLEKETNLTHFGGEMTTLLKVLLSNVSLLNATPLNIEQTRILKNVQQTADAVLHKVETEMGIHQLDVVEPLYELRPFDLIQCTKSIISMLQPSDQPIPIHLIISQEVPQFVKTDPNAIVAILTNFLSNVGTFARIFHEKQKTLVLKIERNQDQPCLVIFVSEDFYKEGKEISGYPKDGQSKEDLILKDFYRASDIGVAIVHKLVKMLNGSVSLIHQNGLERVTQVSIPFEEVDDRALLSDEPPYDLNILIPKPQISSREASILIAEHDDADMLALEGILIKLGHQECDIHKAASGWEAIKDCKKNGYDLILMETQLPDMDCLKISKEIREQNTNRKTPIVVLSNFFSEKNKEVYRNAGIDDIIIKPFKFKIMQDITKKWLSSDVDKETCKNVSETQWDFFESTSYQNTLALYGPKYFPTFVKMTRQMFLANLQKLSDLLLKDIREGATPVPISGKNGVHEVARNLMTVPPSMIGGVKLCQLTANFYSQTLQWETDRIPKEKFNSELLSWCQRLTNAFHSFDLKLKAQDFFEISGDIEKEAGQGFEAKILIADPDPSTLIFLKNLLEDNGYTVVLAKNGVVALQLSQIEDPDLLLLDTQLPGLTGYDVCQTLRETKSGKQAIPIIFGTATNVNDFTIGYGFETGGNDYIIKPYESKKIELLAKVKTQLRIARTSRKLTMMLHQLNEAQIHLVDAAHHAGMADIAEYVLHNIGNVLNSVCVSSQTVDNILKEHERDLGNIANVLKLLIEKFKTGGSGLQTFIEEKAAAVSEVLDIRLAYLKQNLSALVREAVNQNNHIKKVREYLNNSEKLIHFSGKALLSSKYDVREILENILSDFHQEIQDLNIKIGFSCPPNTVNIQIIKFKLVTTTLIKNAIASLRQVSHARSLSISCLVKNRLLILKVEDTGTCLPEGSPNSVFSQNYHSEGNSRPTDNLHMCYNFVGKLGGELKSETLAGSKTRFILNLPLL